MPKITDYVREGFDRRSRPWDRTELPEWWDLVVWVALAGVIAMLLLGAVFGRGGSSEDAGGDERRFAVRSLNPYTVTPAPSADEAASATPGTGAPSPAPGEAPTEDFTATAAVRVPVTGGGTTVVPAGARNVAFAAATAEATGDWTGILFVGAARPSAAPAYPRGSVAGEITVKDPRVTGTGQYLFSATITRDGNAASRRVEITVERGPDGYAIRAR
ncbi:hypothetical protein [Actinomadura sp. HBU206391]|uniref:hypothetical protein n=1 Tax=Actinomadura sp. HBU206391 TaxID=2731692 RepID=UPI00164F6EC4|nr:hypothetical protein [Actinomadura sp. HBU206391]MBC6458083.1 hypothetical protein [Actinomadura sp. HBU206391]